MRTRIACGVGAAAMLLATLTGCTVTKTVSQSELETKTTEALQPKFNEVITTHCKGGLTAKTGSTQECVITAGGQWQLVTVTATDDSGKFNANAIPGTVPQPEWVK